MCTNKRYRNAQGEWKTQPQWHRCVLFGKLAESIQPQMTKGREVSVVGELTSRSWLDSEGNTRYTTEVKIGTIDLLRRPKRETEQSTDATPAEASEADAQAVLDNLEKEEKKS